MKLPNYWIVRGNQLLQTENNQFGWHLFEVIFI